MSLRLYNTRTRATEPFVPLQSGTVRMYVCGLTPSAEAHLGHARSFLFFDVLRRYLVHLGYRVTYVRNVTDIDDRSIAAAAAEGTTYDRIVARFYAAFERSMQRLQLLPPDREPRATDSIPGILSMIGELVDARRAYVARDGVYFAVRSFPRYGALSGRKVDELEIGARIAPGEFKRDPLDFALWKFAKPDEPSWSSRFGAGRPGWHIECSAMARALLGEPFDIHGGGFDLIFPHHENEIAQSESVGAAPMANVWMHGGLLQFDGRKMSKSLGNFEPLTDLLDRHDPQAIRLLFLQTGYRKPMNFTEDSIAGATVSLGRLFAAYDRLREAAPLGAPSETPAVAGERRAFFAALDDDLNTASAIAVLFELAGAAAAVERRGAASEAAALLHEGFELLGISPQHRLPRGVTAAPATRMGDVGGVPHEVRAEGDVRAPLAAREAALRERLAAAGVAGGVADGVELVFGAIFERLRAKAARDFVRADAVRAALSGAGVTLRDGKSVTSWSVEPQH